MTTITLPPSTAPTKISAVLIAMEPQPDVRCIEDDTVLDCPDCTTFVRLGLPVGPRKTWTNGGWAMLTEPHSPGDVLAVAWTDDPHQERLFSEDQSPSSGTLKLKVTGCRPVKLPELTEEEAIKLGMIKEDLEPDPDNFQPPNSYGYVSGLFPFPLGKIHVYATEALAEYWAARHPDLPFASAWAWYVGVKLEGGA